MLHTCDWTFLRIDYCDEWQDYLNGDISVTNDGTYTYNISLSRPELDFHPPYIKGNVNLKPIFPLLFFHPRFLTYYYIDPFNTLQGYS